MYRNCVSLCSLCEGEERQTQFTYHFYSLITGIETNMLLIILLDLFAKLALVSGHCDVGFRNVTNFYFPKVGIAWVNNLIAVQISKYQLDISECVHLNK